MRTSALKQPQKQPAQQPATATPRPKKPTILARLAPDLKIIKRDIKRLFLLDRKEPEETEKYDHLKAAWLQGRRGFN